MRRDWRGRVHVRVQGPRGRDKKSYEWLQIVQEAASKMPNMGHALRRPTRKDGRLAGDGPRSLWTDSIIRASVIDAEAERPGGLDGAAGDIKPADIHALLEARWGRKLTREEKQFANQRLAYNIMQLEPPSVIRERVFLGNAYNGAPPTKRHTAPHRTARRTARRTAPRCAAPPSSHALRSSPPAQRSTFGSSSR